MKLLVLACLLGLSAAMSDDVLELLKHRSIPKEAEKLSGQELVDYLNTKQSFFKAKLNPRFAGMNHLQKAKRIGGVRGSIKHMGQQLKKHIVDNSAVKADIPESFDSRTQWANCPSIGYIRDQSSCGSCWAFGATEAISDRICIASAGKTQVEISAADLLACCGFSCGFGCDGGYPISAWRWWVSNGIVTGSNYADQSGCYPYTMPECEHHTNATHYKPCPVDDYPEPTCVKSCPNSGYKTSYTQDKYYGKSAYGVGQKVADIQKEIMLNGPLEASYDVYEDFEHYSGGVYVHQAGQYMGGHAVRVLGWGVDAGTPYWLVANSWNTDWGEKGYFRIIRGTNECGFEEAMVGGLPKL